RLNVAARESESRAAVARVESQRALHAAYVERALTGIDFEVARRWHAQGVIYLPGRSEKIFRQVACYALQVFAVMHADGRHLQPVHVRIQCEAVDGGEPREVFLG